ncbi:lysophospholipid acyltransferase family protein [Alteribacillus sp. HJP-4]|uniref:lysophospholipid acyltransferase family protein n=1 Tax=Alteribacillus sp. HJP-4 TaxID=2775394 RepID=UPI0035CD2BD9
MTIYKIGRFLCRLLFSSVMKAQVIGKENIPEDRAVLLCSNHISNFDPPLVGSFLKRQVHYLAKEELFQKKVIGPLLNALGAFPVKRGMGDRQALRKGLGLLEEGKVLCLFPEGTRSRTGEIGKGLSGAGFFALRSNAVIIPVAVLGDYKPFKRVTVVYGKPISFQELRDKKINAAIATEVIMNSIQETRDQVSRTYVKG